MASQSQEEEPETRPPASREGTQPPVMPCELKNSTPGDLPPDVEGEGRVKETAVAKIRGSRVSQLIRDKFERLANPAELSTGTEAWKGSRSYIGQGQATTTLNAQGSSNCHARDSRSNLDAHVSKPCLAAVETQPTRGEVDCATVDSEKVSSRCNAEETDKCCNVTLGETEADDHDSGDNDINPVRCGVPIMRNVKHNGKDLSHHRATLDVRITRQNCVDPEDVEGSYSQHTDAAADCSTYSGLGSDLCVKDTANGDGTTEGEGVSKSYTQGVGNLVDTSSVAMERRGDSRVISQAFGFLSVVDCSEGDAQPRGDGDMINPGSATRNAESGVTGSRGISQAFGFLSGEACAGEEEEASGQTNDVTKLDSFTGKVQSTDLRVISKAFDFLSMVDESSNQGSLNPVERIMVEKEAENIKAKNENSVDRNTSVGDRNTSVGDPNTSVGDPNTSVGDPNTSVDDPNTSVGDRNTSVDDPNTSVGDPNTYVGDPNATDCAVHVITASPQIEIDASPHSPRTSAGSATPPGVALRNSPRSRRSRLREKSCESVARSGSPGSGSTHSAASLSGSSDSVNTADDSEEDDDGGVYAESFRYSSYMFIGDGKRSRSPNADGASDISANEGSSSSFLHVPGTSDSASDGSGSWRGSYKTSGSLSMDEGLGLLDTSQDSMDIPGDVFLSKEESNQKRKTKRLSNHSRSESISTTASEQEFRARFRVRKRHRTRILRDESAVMPQRLSEKSYVVDQELVVEKEGTESGFGFHIWGARPVIVSTVEGGSAAQRVGLKEGAVLLTVNDVPVANSNVKEVTQIIGTGQSSVKLGLSCENLLGELPVMCGYLTKQGGSGLLKNWRRRWFVLKQDYCLYYYKNEGDLDPLGAIPIHNYTVTKASEIGRKMTFKITKFGSRTYYFSAETAEDMNSWANALSRASETKDKGTNWLDISTHNVGLAALCIKNPDCHGYMHKMGNRNKSWRKRYCVLKDACVYYYIDVNSSTAKGVAHLHGYRVQASSATNKKFSFMLLPPETDMRTFHFYAENETEQRRWMTGFQDSISRWVKCDPKETP